MSETRPLSTFLGFDVGKVNTRASLFGISEEKYRLQSGSISQTSIGSGFYLSSGVREVIEELQRETGYTFLKPARRSDSSMDSADSGQTQFGLVTSAGPWLKAVLLGVTAKGSLSAGRALVNSLYLTLSGAFGLAELENEPAVIDTLVRLQPDILIITGGEDFGASEPVCRWVEIARLVCQLVPSSVRPLILYAGNPIIEETVRRRLEPMALLHTVSNLRPVENDMELVPAQALLDRVIWKKWQTYLPGLKDLIELAGGRTATTPFALSRMVRFVSRVQSNHLSSGSAKGVLALDLGSSSTIVSAGLGGQIGTVVQPAWLKPGELNSDAFLQSVFQWTAAPVTIEEVHNYISNQSLFPALVPENVRELAVSQALARVQLQQSLEILAKHYSWVPSRGGKGMIGQFEPVIASGSVLTNAPTAGQTMLMLLDGLQPRGVTTMVLDTRHILPVLGMAAESVPVLPVHVLDSGAFTNLGSVIVAVSDAPEGETLLTIRVKPENGKQYAIDIAQGTLRRLLVPEGVSVVLELEPQAHTDVGFGAPGMGGRLKVRSGVLGVVIDARGRPLRLPEDDEKRVDRLRQWLWNLGG